MKRSTGKALLGLAIGAAFFAAVAWQMNWDRVGEVLAASRPIYLLPIAFLLVLHYFFKALRWKVLLSGATAVGPLLAMRLTMVGFLMNNVFPARIGELGRPWLLSANREDVPFAFAVASVVADKLFDLVLVIVCLVVPSLFLPVEPWVRAGIAVLAAASFCIVAAGLAASAWQRREESRPREERKLLRLCGRFGARGERLYDALLGFANGLSTVSDVRRVLLALLCSVISFGLLAVVVYLTLRMVNLEAGAITCLFVIGMIGIGFMFPSAPTNAGNFHFFAQQALVLAGAAGSDEAFSFALVAHVSQVVLVTVVGSAALIGLDWRRAVTQVKG